MKSRRGTGSLAEVLLLLLSPSSASSLLLFRKAAIIKSAFTLAPNQPKLPISLPEIQYISGHEVLQLK